MKKYTIIGLGSLLLMSQGIESSQQQPRTGWIAAGTSCIAAIATYCWLRSPLKVDTQLRNLNILTFKEQNGSPSNTASIKSMDAVCSDIQKGCGVQNDGAITQVGDKTYNLSCQLPTGVTEDITIGVKGYDAMSGNARHKGAGGAWTCAKYKKKGLIKEGPCVSFDAPVNYRRTFNFGQELDQACLDRVYQAVTEANPQAKIILTGSCKGGTTILNYLASGKHEFKNVKAAVLESPSSSFEPLIEQVAQNHLPKFLRPVLPKVFWLSFPNFKWKQPTILHKANQFPDHIKLLMGSIVHDKTASSADTQKIADALKSCNKSVELFACDDKNIKHGHLSENTGFQQKVSDFYKSIDTSNRS